MVRLMFALLILLTFNSYANKVELFYDGFWSHHSAPKKLEYMVDRHNLAFDLFKSSIPTEYKKLLLEGYILNKNAVKIYDHILYIKETDKDGKLIREISGGNEYLLDLQSNKVKKLTDIQKRLLNNYIKDVSCMKSDFLSYKKVD